VEYEDSDNDDVELLPTLAQQDRPTDSGGFTTTAATNRCIRGFI